MKLTEQLTDYVHAAYAGLWVQTQEPDEAEREIVQHARQQGWKLAAWDVANGLRLPGATSATGPDASDPLAALHALPQAIRAQMAYPDLFSRAATTAA